MTECCWHNQRWPKLQASGLLPEAPSFLPNSSVGKMPTARSRLRTEGPPSACFRHPAGSPIFLSNRFCRQDADSTLSAADVKKRRALPCRPMPVRLVTSAAGHQRLMHRRQSHSEDAGTSGPEACSTSPYRRSASPPVSPRFNQSGPRQPPVVPFLFIAQLLRPGPSVFGSAACSLSPGRTRRGWLRDTSSH